MAVAMPTDTEIQLDVISELDWDPTVDAAEVGVEVDDGVVTLTGWVDTYNKKFAAEQAAQRVVGVRAVANDLSVKGVSTVTDTDIAKAVATALERNSRVPAGRIEIVVKNRKVTLQGEVDWDFQRDEAIRTVRPIEGVRDVINLISIKHSSVSPDRVKQAIETALVRSAELDAEGIRVSVDGSHVVLRGTVRSLAEKTAAEAAAWRAKGVTRVTNEIDVRPI